jgi:hypothetical protein
MPPLLACMATKQTAPKKDGSPTKDFCNIFPSKGYLEMCACCLLRLQHEDKVNILEAVSMIERPPGVGRTIIIKGITKKQKISADSNLLQRVILDGPTATDILSCCSTCRHFH